MQTLERSLGQCQISESAPYDAIIVGAGPYGLSLAAHLSYHQLRIAIFGKPFGFWRDCVPPEISLRSHWSASSLSDPEGRYGLGTYLEQRQHLKTGPFFQREFVDYGLWFQDHNVPAVDETLVKVIERAGTGFQVTLEDERVVQSRRVILATGMKYYAYMPPEYTHLSPEHVSHTSQYTHFRQFLQKRVAVIGGGQSAVETAALLAEQGAHVHLIARHPLLWLSATNAFDMPKRRSLWQRIRRPYARISPGLFNWWIENFPYMFQHLPRTWRDNLLRGKGAFKAAASHQLRQRLEGKAAIHESCQVRQIREGADGICLALTDGQHISVDHIILGTGYRADIQRLPILSPDLKNAIRTYQGTPILNSNFESSVAGLYCVGFASANSFGPLYRFVIGTDAAAQRLTKIIMRSQR